MCGPSASYKQPFLGKLSKTLTYERPLVAKVDWSGDRLALIRSALSVDARLPGQLAMPVGASPSANILNKIGETIAGIYLGY